ncbi:uncharacterized protein LACBIDRAFT_333619 [Laccaria bicolor S238N-H82]|uniref:Predicted protein n=1 Tax=Laccaria bicolor (strain S238N-H82 / ATCC MYA-4686) TaxID=486041 RepID=B0DWI7_LACBS|nr:uncharacterized protein LACBIDRAFT_333619 [Laccaria bicolor S238N-H82]EDR01098.1 predicted protein [Laccaria bicolor S238N-H82]|eukprot:XP_001888317.1 predicted protein [Laccaria bicolor S238N-H82]
MGLHDSREDVHQQRYFWPERFLGRRSMDSNVGAEWGGLKCVKISILRSSRTFILRALLSRQVLTAEGLYNSTPMIGSDCGSYFYKQDMDVSRQGSGSRRQSRHPMVRTAQRGEMRGTEEAGLCGQGNGKHKMERRFWCNHPTSYKPLSETGLELVEESESQVIGSTIAATLIDRNVDEVKGRPD